MLPRERRARRPLPPARASSAARAGGVFCPCAESLAGQCAGPRLGICNELTQWNATHALPQKAAVSQAQAAEALPAGAALGCVLVGNSSGTLEDADSGGRPQSARNSISPKLARNGAPTTRIRTMLPVSASECGRVTNCRCPDAAPDQVETSNIGYAVSQQNGASSDSELWAPFFGSILG